MKQEYRLFGVWRLLAALLVMTYHFAHYAPHAAPVVAWFEHMLPLLDMFFIMSGFLIFEHYGRMENTRRNYLRFLVRRLARLYPLHLITLSVFVGVGLLVQMGLFHSELADIRYDFRTLPANLLLIQAWGVNSELTFNYVSWSLSGEWFAYLMFPVVLFAFARGRTAGLALLLVIIMVGLEFADRSATDKYDFWYNTRAWAAYRVAGDFVFGALLCSATRRFSPPPFCQGLAWSALALVFVAMFAGASIYITLALIGGAIALAALADRATGDGTAWLIPLMPVASVSFGIYLWHPVVELLTYSFLWKRVFAGDNAVLFWACMPVPVILSLLVAMVSAHRFERPAGKWMEATLGALADRNRPTRQQA